MSQLGADSAYNLLRFPLAVAAFVAVVTGLSLGAGLLVVWVGVAVLAITLVVARGFAAVERAMIPGVLGRGLPRGPTTPTCPSCSVSRTPPACASRSTRWPAWCSR